MLYTSLFKIIVFNFKHTEINSVCSHICDMWGNADVICLEKVVAVLISLISDVVFSWTVHYLKKIS